MTTLANITSNDQFIINTLTSIQKQLTYTLLVSLVLVGNIGCILNTMIFSRPYLNSTSCSRYFLGSSFANAFQLNIGLVCIILDYGFGIHPYHHSSVLCKLRNYFINMGGFLSQTYILLACIDRYLVSINKPRYYRLLTKSMANHITYLSVVFWSVSLFHMIIYSDISVTNQFCYYLNSSYVIFISLHNLVLSGCVFPCLMAVFGLLTVRKIRSIQQRTHTYRRTKRRNHYLSLMLISNMLVSVIFTLLYTSGLIYLLCFMSKDNSLKHKVQRGFIRLTATTVYYAQFSVSFYVNILTSERFRCELKQILCKKLNKSSGFFPK